MIVCSRPARDRTSIALPPDLIEKLARAEHDRWIAERLMSGWRPTAAGEARNNELMAHDKIVPWDQLNENDRNNDVVQVRAAMDVARLMHKEGFVPRA
jgi:hypothetical protein